MNKTPTLIEIGSSTADGITSIFLRLGTDHFTLEGHQAFIIEVRPPATIQNVAQALFSLASLVGKSVPND